MTDHVLTAEDIEILLGQPTSEAVGMVYFDDRTGRIAGASQTLDDSIAERFPYVESEHADAFLNGSLDFADWMVVYRGAEPILTRSAEQITIQRSRHGLMVVTDSEPAPVRLIFVVPKDSEEGVVVVDVPDDISVSAGFTEPFSVTLTRRGSIDEIEAIFQIDPTELFGVGEVVLPLGKLITHDLDIVTSPLTSVQYCLQPYHEASRPLALPKGRFDDFRAYQWVIDIEEAPAGILVDYYGDHLTVSLHGGGGRFYERSLSSLMLAICRPGDKEAMLMTAAVSIAALRDGPVEIELTDSIEGPFEVYSQLYFVNAYARNMAEVAAHLGPLPLPMAGMDFIEAQPDSTAPGLHIRVDADRGRMHVSLQNGGGRTYARDDTAMVISFTLPGDLDVPLWTTKVDVAQISDGVMVDLPVGLTDKPFSIFVQRFYENASWGWDVGSSTETVGNMQWVEVRPRPTKTITHPCLALWRGKKLLYVQLIAGGGQRNGSFDEVTIALCRDRDPDTMICSFRVPVGDLQAGERRSFPLPLEWHPELTSGNFEILISSVYTEAYFYQ